MIPRLHSRLSRNQAGSSLGLLTITFLLAWSTLLPVGAANAVGDLQQARVGHTATLLNDGQVLIAGGSTATGITDTAEMFDPTTEVFSSLANSLTTLRTEHTATLLPLSETLLVAGEDSIGVLSSTEMFSTGAGSFRPLIPSVDILRAGHSATGLLDGRILIVGGQSSGTLGSAEHFDAQPTVIFTPAYNPDQGSFSTLSNTLNIPRWDHTATLLTDGRILITGGRDDTGLLDSVEVFDPTTEDFTLLPNSLTASRAGHTATLLPDGRVLLLGGEDSTGSLTSGEIYDPSTETFSSTTITLVTARANHTATLLSSGQILITGGENATGILATAELVTLSSTDTTAPTVLGMQPPSGTTDVETTQVLGVQFSEPVDVTTLTSAHITLDNGGSVSGTISAGEQGLMVFVVPDTPLAPDTTYTLTLSSGITDTSGNPLTPFTGTFTTVKAPTITDIAPEQGIIGTAVMITGTNFDSDPNRNQVDVNSIAALVTTASSTALTIEIPNGATTGPISVTTSGGTATSPTDFAVTPTPVITGISPTEGTVGTSVTLTGFNFDTVAANNQVTFAGETDPIPAIIQNATATTIDITVPQNARTGDITLTNLLGTTASPEPFTVNLSQNFSVAALPGTAVAFAGDQVAYSITASGEGDFGSLIALTATGLPAGVTPSFVPPQIGPGGSSTLTLLLNGAVSAGTASFSVNGEATIDGQSVVQSAPVQLSVLSAGATSFVGRILNDKNEPLQNVQITLLDASHHFSGPTVNTDAAGNFVLSNVPVGNQMFFVDGRGAQASASDTRQYPPVEAIHDIVAGQTNRMPFTIYVPAIDTESVTPTPPGNSNPIIATSPRIPDLEVEIPAGTTITLTEPDGTTSTVNEITMTAVPIDRAPMPLPPGFDAPFFLTIQPGGAVPQNSQGGVIVRYPTWGRGTPGQRIDLFFFDMDARDWVVYGQGTVSDDGRQIIPDPGLVQPRFAWGGYAPPAEPNTEDPPSGPDGIPAADPVDVATGRFLLSRTDMVIPGRFPIDLTRTYRSGDSAFGPFGLGGRHQYDVYFVNPVPANSGGLRNWYTLVLPDLRRVTFVSDGSGGFVSNNDPAFRGAVATLGPSSIQLRFKDGRVWTFNGDGRNNTGRLMRQEDRNGNVIDIARDGQGRITQITEPAGRALTFSYTGIGSSIASITDSIGRTVSYTYSAGRLASMTDPAGGTTQYVYDGQDRMTAITDARNITFITNEYDAQGRVARQTSVDGGVWEFHYIPVDAAGLREAQELLGVAKSQVPPSSLLQFPPGTLIGTAVTLAATVVTDPRGHTTTYRFNSNGYLLEQTNALGQTTVIDRANGTNVVEQVTDPLGRSRTFTYDGSGNVLTITDPANQVTTFTYEPTFNQMTTATDALNQLTTAGYDNKGNLTSVTDPTNATTTITYNTHGQPLTLTDPLNQTTTFTYDDDGNLATSTDPLGHTSTRTYDDVSRLVARTNPNGATTTFRYDPLNNLTQITDALHGITRFSYDGNGNLLTVTDANDHTTTFTYDVLDRVETRTDPLSRQESYQYDLASNLTRFTDRKAQDLILTYDPLDRVAQTTDADGRTTSLTFDAGGRVTGVTDSATGTIAFAYDNVDRVTQETTSQGSVSYVYDALSRRTSMTVNGQAPVTYVYDQVSRLTQVSQGGQTVGIGYDVAGRRTSLSYPNGTSTTYGYDLASRLTNITHTGPSGLIEALTYTYDPAGNRLSTIRANGTATLLPNPVQAAYDAANEQIRFGNPLPASPNLTYDANGNLTSLTDATGTTTYTWDAQNQLSALAGPSGLTASFIYDAFGRRMTKIVNSATTNFLYDGFDIVQELNGSAIIAQYLRSFNMDEPFLRESTTTEFYHSNILGSPLALTNTGGVTDTTYASEPFGRTTQTGSSTNAFQFTGRENDGTGLFYFRARYYSPTLQRFINEDPLGLKSGDENFYAYTFNSPTNLTDPSGLLVIGAGGSFAGGGLGVVDGAAGVVVDFKGNVGGFVSGSGSVGFQFAAASGGTVLVAPFADTIYDLNGNTFDIHLRVGADVTLSIPIGPDSSITDFSISVGDLGLSIGAGAGTGGTYVFPPEDWDGGGFGWPWGQPGSSGPAGFSGQPGSKGQPGSGGLGGRKPWPRNNGCTCRPL